MRAIPTGYADRAHEYFLESELTSLKVSSKATIATASRPRHYRQGGRKCRNTK